MLNTMAVITHISTDLHSIVRIYSTDKVLVHTENKLGSLWDTLLNNYSILDYVLSQCTSENKFPVILQINKKAVYATVHTTEYIYVIGPVELSDEYEFKYHYEEPLIPDIAPPMKHNDFSHFLSHVLLLHNLFASSSISSYDYQQTDIIKNAAVSGVYDCYAQLIFSNRENLKRHNPYEGELRTLNAIAQGDKTYIQKTWQDSYNTDYMSVLTNNPLQNAKYLTIIAITLASRAAIYGGVLPETALSVCDSYIIQIDKVQDPFQMEFISHDAQTRFTQMVIDSKHMSKNSKNKNQLVEQCKDYVYLHLHEKLTVKSIANVVHINPDYLTTLFKQQEGINLYQFIRKQKLTLITELLIQPQYSYIEIANYLGYSSQSHLGKFFKEMTGMTLKEYRELFSKK